MPIFRGLGYMLPGAQADNAARINEALTLYGYAALRGDWIIDETIVTPNESVLEGLATISPSGDFDVIRQHGGSAVAGLLNIDVEGVSGWDSAGVLYNGASQDVSGQEFLPRRATVLRDLRFVGDVTGSSHGVAFRFQALANDDRVMGVDCKPRAGQGSDAIIHATAGSDITTQWITDCEFNVSNWGSPFRGLLMESTQALKYTVNDNYFRFAMQSRDVSEQTVTPVTLIGLRNWVEHFVFDWVSATPKVTLDLNSTTMSWDMIKSFLTITVDGDTLLRSDDDLLLKGDVIQFRDGSGTARAFQTAAGKFRQTVGIILDSGAQLEVTSDAGTPGGTTKNVPINVDGVDYLIEAKIKT